ncbi:MAG: glycosyltransferase family 39 protein [Candidatus Hydrogenedentes bacterium]|nr:glycosyltransferase family 39 protein [Candidatus Hydrogenedentota bacterium]
MTTISVRVVEPNWLVREWRTRRERVWLAAIAILGFALRLIRLGTWPYWHDEVHNLIKMEHLPEVLRGEYVSNHPPLFTILGTAWRAVGLGGNEWTMRLLPVVLGVGAILTLYLFTRHLFGMRAGLFAAFLLAVSPFHVLHSQDLKEYIVLPLTAPIMAYFLYRAVDENRPRLWAAYALAAAGVCYSEFFAGPLLVAVNLWALVQFRGRWNRLPGWLLANFAGALLFLPYCAVLLDKVHNIMIAPEHWWVPKPTPWIALFYLKTIAFGYSDLEPHFKIALAIFALAALAGVILAWKRDWRAASLLLAWFAIPVALVYAVSLLTNSIFLSRAMLPYALAVYILVAVALARIPATILRAAALALFAIIAAFPLYQRYCAEYAPLDIPHRPGIHPPRDYDRAARFILERWQEGDIVIHASACTWLPFYWYGFRDNPNQYTAGLSSQFIYVINSGNPRTSDSPELDHYWPQELQPLVEGKNRVWYVFSEWERKYLPYNATDVWRWMDQHYVEVSHDLFRGIEVFLYVKERAGAPVAVAERYRDDGVYAYVRHTRGLDRAYVKQKPDNGLVASPPAERAGALELRFEDAPVAGALSGPGPGDASGGPTRTVTFSVENRSEREVPCTIEFFASDLLLPFAQLLEERPESDLWLTNRLYTGAPPPETYELATMTAELSGPDDAALTGAAGLAPGDYATYLYMQGAPLDVEHRRGDVHVLAGDVDLAAPVPRGRADLMGWHWFIGAPVSVADGAAPLPIRVTASPIDGVPKSWVLLGYLAFRRIPYLAPRDPEPVLPPWPGDVVLPPSTAMSWAVEVADARQRVDVWAFERTEDGRAHRVFRTYAPEPASLPSP